MHPIIIFAMDSEGRLTYELQQADDPEAVGELLAQVLHPDNIVQVINDIGDKYDEDGVKNATTLMSQGYNKECSIESELKFLRPHQIPFGEVSG